MVWSAFIVDSDTISRPDDECLRFWAGNAWKVQKWTSRFDPTHVASDTFGGAGVQEIGGEA